MDNHRRLTTIEPSKVGPAIDLQPFKSEPNEQQNGFCREHRFTCAKVTQTDTAQIENHHQHLGKTVKTKDEYIESLASELKEWSAQIDLLSAKMEKTADREKLKYIEDVNALHAKQYAAAEKIKELEDATAEAWGTAKETADRIWDDLRIGLANAAAKFK